MIIHKYLLRNLLAAGLVMATFVAAQEVKVPDIVGLTPDSARTLLGEDSLKLSLSSEEVYTDSLPEGVIARQSPLPDSLLTDSVIIRLASPLTIKFPDIVGMDGFKAKALLDSLGFPIYALDPVESDVYPYATIVEASIKADSMVARGTTVGVRVSLGKRTSESTKTSGGIEIRLIERPEFKINSLSLGASDSMSFILLFGIGITNPYPHTITAEAFKVDLKLNDMKITHGDFDLSVPISSKGTAQIRVSIQVPYSVIKPTVAKMFLRKGTYRLDGTYTLKTESGFTQKPFETEGEFEPFAASSQARARLETIGQE